MKRWATTVPKEAALAETVAWMGPGYILLGITSVKEVIQAKRNANGNVQSHPDQLELVELCEGQVTLRMAGRRGTGLARLQR